MSPSDKEGLLNVKLEVFSSQNEIIRLQADAIMELIMILQQHSDVAEADLVRVKEKIDRATTIRAELGL